MTGGDAMGSKRRLLDMLPLEIIERALSFLSVPELCRLRSVCKAWNEIISGKSFHDLCDLNGRSHAYLFMWSVEPPKLFSGPVFQDSLRFLDLHARRWYSIPAAELPRVCGCGNEVESRYRSTNYGLVCELTRLKGTDSELGLAISDPVAKTRRMLPTPPRVFVASNDAHDILSVASHLVSTKIVTAVDYGTGGYRVFLLNNLSHTRELRAQPRMYVHESSTNEWRVVQNLPNGVEGTWASSAVVLHGSIFIVKQHEDHVFKNRLSLFRYRFMEDTWAEVYHMYFPKRLNAFRLVVGGDRLFLSMWFLNVCRFPDPGLQSDPDCPDPSCCSDDPSYPDRDTCFEMYEVLVDAYRRKPVVKFTRAQLQQVFGSEGGELSVGSNGIPCVGSNGSCDSVILGNTTLSRGFRLRRYDLATGSVDELPPHPLVQRFQKRPGDYYTGNVENMKLSLRNFLAPDPKGQTSTGWELVQGTCHYHR